MNSAGSLWNLICSAQHNCQELYYKRRSTSISLNSVRNVDFEHLNFQIESLMNTLQFDEGSGTLSHSLISSQSRPGGGAFVLKSKTVDVWKKWSCNIVGKFLFFFPPGKLVHFFIPAFCSHTSAKHKGDCERKKTLFL